MLTLAACMPTHRTHTVMHNIHTKVVHLYEYMYSQEGVEGVQEWFRGVRKTPMVDFPPGASPEPTNLLIRKLFPNRDTMLSQAGDSRQPTDRPTQNRGQPSPTNLTNQPTSRPDQPTSLSSLAA